MTKNNKIVVVRVRGKIHLNHNIKKSFEMLNLYNKNGCVVIDNTPSNLGMVNKVKDYVTWGEISDDVFKKMVVSRGDLFIGREQDSKGLIKYNKYFVHNKKKYKKFIRLLPPRKGYGKAGVKETFKNNGALGYRGEKINELVERMI